MSEGWEIWGWVERKRNWEGTKERGGFDVGLGTGGGGRSALGLMDLGGRVGVENCDSRRVVLARMRFG